MQWAFQRIYYKQEGLKPTDGDLSDFMISGTDSEPIRELNRRKLPTDMAQSMEGLLTDF